MGPGFELGGKPKSLNVAALPFQLGYRTPTQLERDDSLLIIGAKMLSAYSARYPSPSILTTPLWPVWLTLLSRREILSS